MSADSNKTNPIDAFRLPPSARAAHDLLVEAGHVVSVRFNRNGDRRYRIDAMTTELDGFGFMAKADVLLAAAARPVNLKQTLIDRAREIVRSKGDFEQAFDALPEPQRRQVQDQLDNLVHAFHESAATSEINDDGPLSQAEWLLKQGMPAAQLMKLLEEPAPSASFEM